MKQSRKSIYILLLVAVLLAAAVVVIEILINRDDSGKPIETEATVESADPVTPTETGPVEPTEAPETEPTTQPETEPESEVETETTPQPFALGWMLVLVNADNPVNPADLPEELTTLKNDVQIDDRIYPDLQVMFDDARDEDVFPIVNEGYRTSERQQEIMDDYIAYYMELGDDEDTAKAKALEKVAVPGTSEHELGLSVDIVAADGSTDEQVYAWLAENAWKYGFILRYPEGRKDVTGIEFEPWHYRYVGKEAAAEIHESGEVLEEYVARICEN